jgi:MarR family multiple antibiotic resistance transcriptional regulator
VARYGGRARVQDLSADIGITVGAASKLADRLERDGLTARTPNPADRRSSLIGLTDSGQQALTSGAEVFGRAVARALGDEDVEVLTDALRRLQSRLDEPGVRIAA